VERDEFLITWECTFDSAALVELSTFDRDEMPDFNVINKSEDLDTVTSSNIAKKELYNFKRSKK